METSTLVRDVLQQASQDLLKHNSHAPSTLDFLIQKLADAWNLSDDQPGIDRIKGFGVPNGTLYKSTGGGSKLSLLLLECRTDCSSLPKIKFRERFVIPSLNSSLV